MTKVRDDARRNARRKFASYREDGAPVGSVLIAYNDGCVDGLLESGDVFTSSFSSDHTEGHTPWLRAPFRYEQFDDLTYVDYVNALVDDYCDDADGTS